MSGISTKARKRLPPVLRWRARCTAGDGNEVAESDPGGSSATALGPTELPLRARIVEESEGEEAAGLLARTSLDGAGSEGIRDAVGLPTPGERSSGVWRPLSKSASAASVVPPNLLSGEFGPGASSFRSGSDDRA